MRGLITGVVGGIVLVLAAGTFGDVVELPLNCAGFYDVNTPAWTMDFDLGVTFSEISNVYIDWSGLVTAGLQIDNSGGTPSEPYPRPAVLRAYLGVYPQLRAADVGGGICLSRPGTVRCPNCV